MRYSQYIAESVALAQSLINDLHAREPDHMTFEQCGLLDGSQIVTDFLSHGETGCALHHLLYMIHESDIRYPRDRMLALHAMADELGEENYYSVANLKNLSPDQLRNVYNAPQVG